MRLLVDKEHKRALEQAMHAVALSPDDPRAHVLVAKAHRLMHNLQEAHAAVQVPPPPLSYLGCYL